MRAISRLLLATLMAAGAPAAAHAQRGGTVTGLPLEDTRIELPEGRHMRVRNRSVFVGAGQSPSLTLVVETPTPATDAESVGREAAALANVVPLDAYEARLGKPLGRLTVLVCRTQACVEMRDVTDEIFTFARDAAGRWVREAD